MPSRRPSSFSAPSRPWRRLDAATEVTIGFERGDAVSIDGERLSPATLLAGLNALGRDNGIGRRSSWRTASRHEKSRRLRDAGRHDPGGAPRHRSITLDRGAMHLKDELMRYAALIYNGFRFSPERDAAGANRQEPGARRGSGASSSTRAT